MFEFHNLGAIAAGAVLIGALQLQGHGMDAYETERETGAKSVTISSRATTDHVMQSSSGLDAFARSDREPPELYQKAMVLWDRATEEMIETGRVILASLTD
ncbi:hypothetical protein [Maritimibacter sp. UBA3975]|uniref:hypothetical protein n=1 Tax=Maritimibacter sp. UBA3975 TaxID=1946833 RepID=UPI000C0A01DB|nr:hypothetical protein [Maritimibacter sp. UBA3975]MAM61493.1 hypothetical protein [Maritimibacter sp.]|tara:strand:+ start:31492 stop:31794 length:303 start_codon:yes stop_codon:yes gene_type:complete